MFAEILVYGSILTVSVLKHPRTPTAAPGMVEYQNPDHEQLMKRLRPAPSVEEVISHFLFVSVIHFLDTSLLVLSLYNLTNLSFPWFCLITNLMSLFLGYISNTTAASLVIGWPAKNSGFDHASRIQGHKHGFSSIAPHIVTWYEVYFYPSHQD